MTHDAYKRTKCNCYFFWRLAIKLLKPKRIICKDNLYYNFSILLAAKIEGIEIVGVNKKSMIPSVHPLSE